MTEQTTEPAIDAIAALVPATLRALYALEFVARHVSPATLPRLIEAIAGRDVELGKALAHSRETAWPERLAPVRRCLEGAAEAAGDGISSLQAAGEAPQPIVAAYRGLRAYAREMGVVFQITDDLLDVTSTAEKTGKAVGKDAEMGKATLVTLLGVDGARAEAQRRAQAAIAALGPYAARSPELSGLPLFLLDRES